MIRQLHYTSCRHGRDGIQGFQVAAATPGIPGRHEDLALPLAAFRPPPSAAAVPSRAEIAAMPVAMGFRDFGDVAVLFRSHYLGQDYTGRQGNYFAHVILADRPALDLGVLPAALWEAAFWSHGPALETADLELPPVETITRGPRLPEVDDQTFSALLGAAREALEGRIRQVVVVGRWPHPDADVAAAVFAVTSALPTHLAHRLSFTTFTARPHDADVLVAGTSPDVSLGEHTTRERIVLHLTDPVRGPEPAFDSMVRRRREDAAALAALVALGDEIRPPLRADELDAFAAAVTLLAGTDGDADPLSALEFLTNRHPAALGPAVWTRVEAMVTAGAVPVADLERWSAVLGRNAGHHPLLNAVYLRSALSRAALSGPAADGGSDELWLPDPTPGATDGIVAQAVATIEHDPRPETAVEMLRMMERLGVEPADADLTVISDLLLLPLALDPDGDVTPFRGLAIGRRLAEIMVRQLEQRLDDDLIGAAVEGMTVDDARWLADAADPGGSVALATALRLAAAGERDSVELVVRHASGPAALDRLVGLAWPSRPPTPGEGVRLLTHLDPAFVAASMLPAVLADGLVAVADHAGVIDDGVALARQLLALEGELPAGVRTCADAFVLTDWFRRARGTTEEFIEQGNRAAGVVHHLGTAGLASHLASVVVYELFRRRAGLAHATVLDAALAAGPSALVDAYTEQLGRTLDAASPQDVVDVLPAVVHVSTTRPAAAELLEGPCARALGQRRRKTLDEIGTLIATRGAVDPRLRPRDTQLWDDWWRIYRERHLDRRGRFSRMWGGS
jgi:hypothetical protein